MQSKYDSTVKKDTWELIELPENKVPTGSKWVYKSKFYSNGSIDKFKYQLVPKSIHKIKE
jgi:hypothetical protein